MSNPFSDLKSLVEKLDLKRIGELAKKVDLVKVIGLLTQLEPSDLAHLATQVRAKHRKKPLPEANGDFYDFGSLLPSEDHALRLRVREYMSREIAPIVNDYWLRGEFPKQVIPGFAELRLAGLTFKGHGFPGRGCVLEGLIAEEIARVDVSMSTFFGVQAGLAMGSIYLCGSEEQKKTYLPKMKTFELLGAFGLTEPNVGSGAAGGLETTCKRDGESWILNGKKKWIGNATFSDFTIIWARNEDDNQVKGFIVDRETPGFSAVKIEDKMALRIVQNAEITLTDCRVPESKRLQNANTFKDTANVLRATRAGVARQAVGCARGAYEHTIGYVQDRQQFGRPIGSFQLVQDMVAHMLSQLTAMQSLCFRLSQIQDSGNLKDEHASLAKVFCTTGCREVVSQARELHGGNGHSFVAKCGSIRRRQRSALLVRRHQASEQLDRRQGRHRLQRVRLNRRKFLPKSLEMKLISRRRSSQ